MQIREQNASEGSHNQLSLLGNPLLERSLGVHSACNSSRGGGLSMYVSQHKVNPQSGITRYKYIDNHAVIPHQIQLHHSTLMEVDPSNGSSEDQIHGFMIKPCQATTGVPGTAFTQMSQTFPAWCVGAASVVPEITQAYSQQFVQVQGVIQDPPVHQTSRGPLWINGFRAFKQVTGKDYDRVYPQLEGYTHIEPIDPRIPYSNIYQENKEVAQMPYYHILYYQQQNQASMYNMPCSILHYVDSAALELYHSVNGSDRVIHQLPSQANVRGWYERALSLAREKYKEKCFAEAYQILHNLHQVDPANIPVLLLLGCTCYSLSMHQLSIHYNNLILQIDPNFVEALSNLGTTYRALAQNDQTSIQDCPQERHNVNFTYHLSMAEKCYRTAIAIRPKYWDANINLSVLLCTNGRNREAVEVQNDLERLFESELEYSERFDLAASRLDVELCNISGPSNYMPGVSDLMADKRAVELLCSIEKRRIARGLAEFHPPNDGLGFTNERRRDLYYSKGCLYHAMGDIKLAKLEYHKGLAVIGIDLNCLYRDCWLGLLPQQLLTPQQALAALQSHQQNRQRQCQNKNNSCGKPLTTQQSQNTYTSCPALLLPSLSGSPLPPSIYSTSTSSILQTLAKIYQDCDQPGMSITLYYYSLGIYPTANACNNIGILLAQQRLNESINWYSFGLSLDPNHVHLLTNIGSALKDRGQINEGVMYYQKAISVRPDFYIVLVNLANVYKDLGRIQEAARLYRKSLKIMPNFAEAFCNYVNILLFMCDWTDRDESLEKMKQILYKQLTEKVNNGLRSPPTILPFHTFTYPGLEPWMIREISHRNAQKVVLNVTTSVWFPGFPDRPNIALSRILSELTSLGLSAQVSWSGYTSAQTDQDVSRFTLKNTDNRTSLLNFLLEFSMELMTMRTSSISMNYNSSGDTSNIISRFLSILSGIDPLLYDATLRLLNYPFPYRLPPPPDPIMNIGYVSSDFNNHPLAHLMQSVFGMHDRSRYRVFCYALTPTDMSPYREKIQSEADVFIDVSLWTTGEIVSRIVNVDKIHILCNLNGYTKGVRNEIFATRPAPVQMQFMGFAGTMGGGESYDPDNLRVYIDERYSDSKPQGTLIEHYFELDLTEQEKEVIDHYDSIQGCFIDYLVADEISCPRRFVCNEPLHDPEITLEPEGDPKVVNRGFVREEDDCNRVYTESILYLPHSYFVNDHRQGLREHYQEDIEKIIFGKHPPSEKYSDFEDDPDMGSDLTVEEKVLWTREQLRRVKARSKIFPMLRKDVVIYANFNQLYKIDPEIFSCWVDILKAVPNSILWLLRFPAAGEFQLGKRALELGGEEIVQRIIFTDVAPKNAHVYRGRVADVFLDTPECNAHTTAADILWSGTPVVTYPKYDFKMCSRVCSSVAAAAGSWKDTDLEEIDGKTKSVMMAKAGIRLNGAKSLEDPNLLAHWMITKSYEEYKRVAINFGITMKWEWMKIFKYRPKVSVVPVSDNLNSPKSLSKSHIDCTTAVSGSEDKGPSEPLLSSFYPSLYNPTHVYCVSTSCLAGRLRMRLFLSREHCDLFDTRKWVRCMEVAYEKAYAKFCNEREIVVRRNEVDILNSVVSWGSDLISRKDSIPGAPYIFNQARDNSVRRYDSYIVKMPPYVPKDPSRRRKNTRCIWVHEDEVTRPKNKTAAVSGGWRSAK